MTTFTYNQEEYKLDGNTLVVYGSFGQLLQDAIDDSPRTAYTPSIEETLIARLRSLGFYITNVVESPPATLPEGAVF